MTSVRDPDAFSVAKSMASIRTFDAIPDGERSKIRLSFHVFANNNSPMPAGARMSLATAEGDKPMELLPSGELVVPKLSETEANGAEFVSNMRKGSLRVTYFVQPKMVNPMTMGYLREALTQAKAAYKKLYGPMLGWSVPTFTCAVATFMEPNTVTVHAPAAGATASWTSANISRLSIPLADPSLQDDFVVDWGARTPIRLGGCVDERKAAP